MVLGAAEILVVLAAEPLQTAEAAGHLETAKMVATIPYALRPHPIVPAASTPDADRVLDDEPL
tara:strand:+ start:1381 stop:1569 length:189 start_codon:yes stop_codon:yes gene_type:complete